MAHGLPRRRSRRPPSIERSRRSAHRSTRPQLDWRLTQERSAPSFATVAPHPRSSWRPTGSAPTSSSSVLAATARSNASSSGPCRPRWSTRRIVPCSWCGRPASLGSSSPPMGPTDGSAAAAFLGTSQIFGEPAVKVVSVVDPGMPWWASISPVDGAVAADAYASALAARGRSRAGRREFDRGEPWRRARRRRSVAARRRGRFDHRRRGDRLAGGHRRSRHARSWAAAPRARREHQSSRPPSRAHVSTHRPASARRRCVGAGGCGLTTHAVDPPHRIPKEVS